MAVLPAMLLRELVIVVAEVTGWSRAELLGMEPEELLAWNDAIRRARERGRKASGWASWAAG